LLDKMFASSESNLEPDLARGAGEGATRGQRFWRRREQRQRLGKQAILARTERPAAAASV
jgi:hypothetical protein